MVVVVVLVVMMVVVVVVVMVVVVVVVILMQTVAVLHLMRSMVSRGVSSATTSRTQRDMVFRELRTSHQPPLCDTHLQSQALCHGSSIRHCHRASDCSTRSSSRQRARQTECSWRGKKRCTPTRCCAIARFYAGLADLPS